MGNAAVVDFGDELWNMCPVKLRQWNGDKKTGHVKFTGWKGDSESGYVAQWIWYKDYGTKNSTFYYVNLPGGEMGTCRGADNFDIGTERIRGPLVTPDHIRQMVEYGKMLLYEMVKEKEGIDISQIFPLTTP
jgi:hypothetical protein